MNRSQIIETNEDISPVLYLVEKYCTKRDRIADMESELARLKSVRGVA